MTVTIRVRTEGLQETQRGLQQIIALQRELAATSANIRPPNIAQPIARAGQAATQATTGFRSFSREVSGANDTLSGVQQRLISFRQANAQLANSFGIPINAVRLLNTALGTLPNQTAEVVGRFAQFRNAGATLDQTFNALNQEFGVSAEQFQTLANTVGASTQALSALAAGAAIVSSAIGNIFRQGLQDFIAFDSILRQIQAISGQTADELSGLEEEIIRLGSSTQFTNTEVATAARNLLRLGLTADEVEVALGGIVDGARASGESLGTVSRIVATTINQFEDLTAASATGVSDVLAATANNSATSVGALGQALSFVGTAANDFNQSAEDTATAIGLIANAGIPAGRAGRNLARAIQQLQSAAAEGSDSFESLGVQIVDAQGQFRPLLDIIPEIRDSLDELSELDQAIVLDDIFGTEGGRAIRALLASTNEDIENLRRTVNNAAGSAAAAGDVLTTGLGGALTELEASTETASSAIGDVLAPAAEVAVRAATTLIQAFNSLNPVIQTAIVGVTGFVGILAAAVGTVATYQAAIRLLNLEQIALALSTVQSTIATSADTVAKNLNLAATISLTGVGGALIAVLRGQAAAFLGAAGSAGTFLATLGPFIGLLAAVAAAGITLNEVWQRTQDAGDELRANNIDVSESLEELGVSAENANDSLEDLADTPPVPRNILDGFLDGIVSTIQRVGLLESAITNLINIIPLVPDIEGISTNAEKRANDLRIAIFESTAEVNELSDASLDLAQTLANGFGDSAEEVARYEETLRQATEIQQVFDDLIAEQRADLAALDEEALGSRVFDELTNSIEVNINALIRQRETLTNQVDAARLAAVGVEDVGESARLSATELEELTEALEDQRDALREAAEEEFRIEARAGGEDFRRQQQTQQRNFQNQLQQEEEAFADRQRGEERRFQTELQGLERQNRRVIESEERRLQQELQNDERAFNREQQDSQRAFQREQEAARAAFEDTLDAQRTEGEAEISRLRLEAERALQLEQAGSREEREELEERFENEDAIAERRTELLEPVLERERELEAELAAARAAFEEQQNAEALAFEAELEQQKLTFENTLEQRRLRIEEQIQALRDQSEEQLAQRRLQFEEQQANARGVFEDQLEQRRINFADQQRAEQIAFEDQQRAAERAFREEQRALDEQSAQDIEAILGGTGLVEEIRAILESTDVPSTEQAEAVKEILESINIPGVSGQTPAFRTGGVSEGGIAKVGEVGPEFAALPKGTRVLSKNESRRAVQQAVNENPSLASKFGPIRAPKVTAPNRPQVAPILSTPAIPDSSPLLLKQLGAIQQLNRTESRVLAEVNRVRRTQQRGISRSSSNNPGVDSIDLMLASLL